MARSGWDVLRGALRHLKRMKREAKGLGESLAPNDQDLKDELKDALDRRQRRNAARKPRGKRGPTPEVKLAYRGLRRVLRDYPKLKASELRDQLDAEGRVTYDDDDLELRRDGDDILIRDLAEGADPASVSIAVDSLSTYLTRARNS